MNRVKCVELFEHSPNILGDQKYQEKCTYMCFKVVQSSVFGPIFIARNNYIKLVTIQICWMHLLFVLVVFHVILCPIEMNGK